MEIEEQKVIREIRDKIELLLSDADAVSKKLKFQEENKNEKQKN
ncbi:MAG: hypothetical protein ABIB79_04210 [archaeon]